jgi:hypothetical protein
VADRPDGARALEAALAARGARCHVLDPSRVGTGFDAAAAAVAAAEPFEAVVLQRSEACPAAGGGWQGVLAEHRGVVDGILGDAAWVRAVADRSAAASRPVRIVTLVDADHTGGRSRAQAAAQLARSSLRATDERVAAYAVSVEAGPTGAGAAAELAAHLACSPVAADLAGAELVAGDGWVGLRSHPRPGASITTGPGVPDWFDAVLRQAVGHSGDRAPEVP